ncbi:hypothetical protein niasHT_024298 [Heterodera trifolii]|uniref:Uncharacterized protein n=1 Tax=Heterodera trifolii TaxID=157864 RepID=A0ABD2JM72_9BILA
MLGMMNCQTENYEFYASPPSSSAPQFRGQQQPADELFNNRKQKKPQITYTDGRRLIDGKMGEASRQEPTKLWNRVIVDNLTARRLRREQSNRKEEEKATEERDERHKDDDEEEEEEEKRREGEEMEEAMGTSRKQKHKRSFSGILSKLMPRKKSY